MPKRTGSSAIVCAVVLVLGACQREPEDATLGDPLPDTVPVAGTSSDLPEEMPLPPEPEDTYPE